MAGVKGRSGGPRPNSGGRRPGAGRPRKKPAQDAVQIAPGSPTAGETAAAATSVPPVGAEGAEAKFGGRRDPLAWLEAVMHGEIDPTGAQLKAAIAAAKYRHAVPSGAAGAPGKKEEAAKKAGEAVAGRFGPRAAPLRVVNG